MKTTVTSYDLYYARALPYKEKIKVLKNARDNGGLTLNISLRSATATDLDAELLYQADKLSGYKREMVEATTESASEVPPVEPNLTTEAPVAIDNAEDALLVISAAEITEYSKDYPKQSIYWIKDVAIPQIELKAFMQIARLKFPGIPRTPFEAAIKAIVSTLPFEATICSTIKTLLSNTERPDSKFIENVENLYKSLWKTNHFSVKKSYSLEGALVEARKKGDGIVLHVGVRVTDRAPVFLESQVEHYSPESIADNWNQQPTRTKTI